MGHDIKKFRSIRHGKTGETAYCRMCKFSLDSVKDKNVTANATSHAKRTLHTVDIYRENHTELTSYTKNQPPKLIYKIRES